MYVGIAIAGALAFIASLVIERLGTAGAGATPPSNEALINTLRLGGLTAATVGLSGVLILNSAGL